MRLETACDADQRLDHVRWRQEPTADIGQAVASPLGGRHEGATDAAGWGSLALESLMPPAGSIESGPVQWLATVVWATLGAVATSRIPAIWRGGVAVANAKRAFAVFGEPWATALVSAAPVGALTSVVLALAALCILGREATGGDLQGMLGSVALILLVPGLLTGSAGMSVLFFGRPKSVMPPTLRDSHGIVGSPLLAAWTWLRSRAAPRP